MSDPTIRSLDAATYTRWKRIVETYAEALAVARSGLKMGYSLAQADAAFVHEFEKLEANDMRDFAASATAFLSMTGGMTREDRSNVRGLMEGADRFDLLGEH